MSYNRYPPEGPNLASNCLWLAALWLAIILVGVICYRWIF
jgi:hypothetical protein